MLQIIKFDIRKIYCDIEKTDILIAQMQFVSTKSKKFYIHEKEFTHGNKEALRMLTYLEIKKYQKENLYL